MRYALVVLLALTSCAPYQPGSRFDVSGVRGLYHVEIEETRAAASERCTAIYRGVKVYLLGVALSCAIWRDPPTNEGRDIILTDDLMLPAAYSCIIIAAPVRWMVEHELRHCDEGAWH